LYGTTGSTALLIGRELLRLDEVQRGVGFLEDAAELFELATRQALDGRCSEGFSMVVAHSKMGETYTRLHALSNDETHAELAIRHFRRAQELGNSTAELTGMLGDVYYRTGRNKLDASLIRYAIELKTSARKRALLAI
jgi:Flp pilus assembly protein TadD